jgi:hypothetical protein
MKMENFSTSTTQTFCRSSQSPLFPFAKAGSKWSRERSESKQSALHRAKEGTLYVVFAVVKHYPYDGAYKTLNTFNVKIQATSSNDFKWRVFNCYARFICGLFSTITNGVPVDAKFVGATAATFEEYGEHISIKTQSRTYFLKEVNKKILLTLTTTTSENKRVEIGVYEFRKKISKSEYNILDGKETQKDSFNKLRAMKIEKKNEIATRLKRTHTKNIGLQYDFFWKT